MALVVTFTSKVPLPLPSAGTGYMVWSYKVDSVGGGQNDLPAGQRIALGLPHDLDVQNPDAYPGVPQVTGTFLQRDAASSRQYVGRIITSSNAQTISFIAPAAESSCEMFLVRAPSNQPWASVLFSSAAGPGATPSHVQTLTAPRVGPPASNGRPITDFTGTLPYASEVFGVYQPLAGWYGVNNTLRAASMAGNGFAGLTPASFVGERARMVGDEALAALVARFGNATVQGVLSPVGLVNLFRQYFFEFDSFLGPPAGHLWLSPGGTVEIIEVTTRRTLVERTAEQSEEISRKSEESLTEQDDIADAVKEENANDTKLGVSATGGVNAGIYHADASMSFSADTAVKRSSEETHKRSRTQSAKVTSELKRNFKTTFKTVTETTDTASRRYVVENKGNELVNYELRRKMRKIGVQLQHIGTRLSWQIYLPTPGRDLGLGDLVHIVEAPDLTAIQKPEKKPRPLDKQVTYALSVPFHQTQAGDSDNDDSYTPVPGDPDTGQHGEPTETNQIKFRFDFPLPPPPEGFELSKIAAVDFHGAQVEYTTSAPDLSPNPDPAKNSFTLRLTFANFQGKWSLPVDVTMDYTPNKQKLDEVDKANAEAEAAYAQQVVQLQRQAYGDAVRDRLKLVSSMRTRRPEDLRGEERHTVFAQLIDKISLVENPDHQPDPPEVYVNKVHLNAELIQQIFDVNEMLYFVAPNYWRPHGTSPQPDPIPHTTEASRGKYPVPGQWWDPDRDTVISWYSQTGKTNGIDEQGNMVDEFRVDYLITEETQPAPLGSSLGWLIQADGDERRNEFLNAAWVKAVLPVRPGHELDALEWLAAANVEGEAALDLDYPFQPGDPPDYQGKKVGQVLHSVATELQAANTDTSNLLATEEAFETGFDPLAGGFRPAEPYQIFDQWAEVLPTDQIAAVQVTYNPQTGQQV